MSINKDELTKEQIQKAMACETAEELMALAKAEGAIVPPHVPKYFDKTNDNFSVF